MAWGELSSWGLCGAKLLFASPRLSHPSVQPSSRTPLDLGPRSPPQSGALVKGTVGLRPLLCP